MIYTELHQEERRLTGPILDKIFEIAQQNQIHPQDLFLVINQGYYEKSLEKNELGLSKYILGLPGEAGLEYRSAYEFIHEFRKENLYSIEDYKVMKESVKDSPSQLKEVLKSELIMLQIEQLVYLKIWESNFIIRIFYQLARLIDKQGYDWDFSMVKRNRKDVWIKLIRNKIARHHPSFGQFFDSCYKSQFRNAIAHSLFFTIGDSITFTNYGHNKGDDISTLSFKDWEPFIHKTLVIFDELIRIRMKIDKDYQFKALQNNNTLEFHLKTKSNDELRVIQYFEGEPNPWGDIRPLITL